jgi:hypothetical protein
LANYKINHFTIPKITYPNQKISNCRQVVGGELTAFISHCVIFASAAKFHVMYDVLIIFPIAAPMSIVFPQTYIIIWLYV